MITRRDLMKRTAAAGAALSLSPSLLDALGQRELISRQVPATGEMLPVVGLGTSATYSRMTRSDNVDPLREVLRVLVEKGGSVVDLAPSYADAEEVTGRLAGEIDAADRIFWATKLNVARRGASADAARARFQVEHSFEHLGVSQIDLIQVHNVAAPTVQVPVLREFKDAGRVRLIGMTSTSKRQYQDLMQAMRDYPMDFIGIDYAVDNMSAADEVLPLAQDRGMGVLVYLPFGRTRLFSRVGDREVPEWARAFGANSWAQFFIKFAAAHPAVTCVTPGTSDPEHMADNLEAGMGRLPNEEEQARMAEFVADLPGA